MKIMIRKDLYDEFMQKAGLPVGTVHGFYKKVSDCPSKWEYVKSENCSVEHDGEFVLTSSGKKDFGEITPEISREIKRQAGKIRLRIGIENKTKDKNNPNYGEKHINRGLRLKNMNDVGFKNARDFVEYICANISYIFNNGKSLIVVREKGEFPYAAYIELVPSSDGDFYDVKTASPLRKDWYKNKTPIWINPNIDVVKKSLGSPRAFQFNKIIESIYGIGSNSFNQNIYQSSESVKEYVEKSIRILRECGAI